ncbi:MAG: hypothetical protein J0L97_10890, partial [Alphaproteobacteria bacterium]|nr:hypothetical protein [Alphaproteobacteria bacterium]
MVLLLQASDEGWPREGAILPLFSSGNAAQSALKFRVVCMNPALEVFHSFANQPLQLFRLPKLRIFHSFLSGIL